MSKNQQSKKSQYNDQSQKSKYSKKEGQNNKSFPFKTALGTQQQLHKYVEQMQNLLKTQNDKAQRIQDQRRKNQTFQAYKATMQQYADDQNKKFIKDETFDEDLVVPVDGDVIIGSQLYSKHCLGCHSLDMQTKTDRQYGPALGLIYRRRVGFDTTYKQYSKQLLAGQFYWSKYALYRFMYNPHSIFKQPKCGLVLNPIKSQSDRADIIQFLKQYYKGLSTYVTIKGTQVKGYDYYQTQMYKATVRAQRTGQKVQGQQKSK